MRQRKDQASTQRKGQDSKSSFSTDNAPRGRLFRISERRKFLGLWIPASVYQYPHLSWSKKIICLDVFSIGLCFKSNETIGGLIGVGERQAEKIIQELVEEGWIKAKDRGRGMKKRCLEASARFVALYHEKPNLSSEQTEKNDGLKPNKSSEETEQKEDRGTTKTPSNTLSTEAESWQDLVDMFFVSHQRLRGEKLEFTGREAKALKQLAKTHTPKEITQKIANAVRWCEENPDSQFWASFPISPSSIATHWNRLVPPPKAGAPKGKGPAKAPVEQYVPKGDVKKTLEETLKNVSPSSAALVRDAIIGQEDGKVLVNGKSLPAHVAWLVKSATDVRLVDGDKKR